MIRRPACAKINLALVVGPVRADGKHELVGARDDGSLQNVAIAIERTSAVLKRLHAGDTDGNIHQSFAPRPDESIGDEQGPTVEPAP